MTRIAYPSDYEKRVLAFEAPGGPPQRLYLTAPTIVQPGEPFALRLAVVDESGFPSLNCGKTVSICGEFAREARIEVPFRADQPAVAVVGDVSIAEEGLFRFSAEMKGKAVYSNPVCCRREASERVYWGDPHVHTVLSDCHPDRCRSLTFCYVAAKWLSGLDWVTPADHVSNGRSTLGKWREQIAASEVFNRPGEFVALPGYEASLKGMCGGDNNVYMLRWPNLFVDEYEEGNVRTLCEKLAAKLPKDEYFAVPHHTTRPGKHGEIPEGIYPGADWMPVVEIHSKWGASEYPGNPNALHKLHPGPASVTHLLERGYWLGFIAGTDTHATMPSLVCAGDTGHIDRLPGLTAVRAGRLTRDGIFRGIQQRSCYAASLERVYLDESVAGVCGGSKIAWPDAKRPRRITLTAAAQSDIVRIDVVRNGQTIHSVEPAAWQATLSHTDADDLAGAAMESKHLGRFVYYYLRLTCSSGAQAWSSPVWLVL